jgi:hypothetical protein
MTSRWTQAASLVLLLGAASCSEARATSFEPTPSAHPANDHTAMRARLAAHRDQQIERLEAYAQAGAFPHDEVIAPSMHMFRDEQGRLCAVANLVHRDGRDDLVDATVRENNGLAIADVHGGAMGEWILSSGLTQEELARVQMPAPLVRRTPPPSPRNAPRGADPLMAGNANANAHQGRPGAMTEAQMDAILRAHLAQVGAELRANREASLDVAVDRYPASAVLAIARQR